MTISLETDHRSMTGSTPGDDGGNGKARWAAMLAASRDEYAAATRLGRGGIETVERYSERMDDMVRAIAAAARQQTSMPVALCAIGGYGRRALCLHSDIDLLLLFERPLTGAEESYVKAVVQPLWDLRLTVGQHVRELADFDVVDVGNPEFLLAALDVRFLSGDERLFEHLVEWLGGRALAAATVDPLLELVERAARTFQQHPLPARARHQAGAGRPSRHPGGAPSAGAAAGRTGRERLGRAGCAARGRELSPAHPFGAAPAVGPRRQSHDPRAPGAGRRGAGLRRRGALSPRRDADGGLLPPRARGHPDAGPGAAHRPPAGLRGSPGQACRPAVRGRERRRPLREPRPGRLAAVAVARGVPARARAGLPPSPSRRWTASSSTSSTAPLTISSRPKGSGSSCACCSVRGAACTRVSRRCTTAGSSRASFRNSRRCTAA